MRRFVYTPLWIPLTVRVTYIHTHTLTFTQSLTHSLTHTHTLIQSHTHWLTHPPNTYTFTHQPTYSPTFISRWGKPYVLATTPWGLRVLSCIDRRRWRRRRHQRTEREQRRGVCVVARRHGAVGQPRTCYRAHGGADFNWIQAALRSGSVGTFVRVHVRTFTVSYISIFFVSYVSYFFMVLDLSTFTISCQYFYRIVLAFYCIVFASYSVSNFW